MAPASVDWEVGNALSAMFKRKVIGMKKRFSHWTPTPRSPFVSLRLA